MDIKTSIPVIIAVITSIGSLIVAVITSRNKDRSAINDALHSLEKQRLEWRLELSQERVNRLRAELKSTGKKEAD